MEEVHGTIEWAKDKLDSFPKAKRDLGPLLDALGRTLSSVGSFCISHLIYFTFRAFDPNRRWSWSAAGWCAQLARQTGELCLRSNTVFF